jgi:hypothetical protein
LKDRKTSLDFHEVGVESSVRCGIPCSLGCEALERLKMQRKDSITLLKQLISESLLRESVTVFDPTLSDERPRSEAHARLLLTREPDLAVVRDSDGTWFAGHPGMPACMKWGQKPIFGSGGKPTGRDHVASR